MARRREPSSLSLPPGLLAAAVALVALPLPAEMATMLAITLFASSLWIGTPVPPWFTALPSGRPDA